MKLLIVEDNELIARTLERNLKLDYQVDLAKDGLTGLHMSCSSSYDVILLDLNLPDIGGEEVCRRVRKKGVTTPLIIVSGKSEVSERITLLNSGADDYLVKPFNIDELRARIRAALRHQVNKAPEGKLILSDLNLDPSSRRVTHKGHELNLRKKEYDLLAYLMYNKGQILTRSMIMEHIWGTEDNLWANVIDVHIKHLRDKVDRPHGTKLIKTVHGVGYKIDV